MSNFKYANASSDEVEELFNKTGMFDEKMIEDLTMFNLDYNKKEFEKHGSFPIMGGIVTDSGPSLVIKTDPISDDLDKNSFFEICLKLLHGLIARPNTFYPALFSFPIVHQSEDGSTTSFLASCFFNDDGIVGIVSSLQKDNTWLKKSNHFKLGTNHHPRSIVFESLISNVVPLYAISGEHFLDFPTILRWLSSLGFHTEYLGGSILSDIIAVNHTNDSAVFMKNQIVDKFLRDM